MQTLVRVPNANTNTCSCQAIEKQNHFVDWKVYGDIMEFKDTLRSIRKRVGMTQKTLASKIGVTPETIGNWERGSRQPSFEYLVSLADALGSSVDILLGRNTVQFSPKSDGAERLYQCYMQLDSYGRRAVDAICRLELDRVIANKQKVVPFIGTIDTDEHIAIPKKNRYYPRFSSPPAAGFGVPLEGEDFEMFLADDSVPEDADYAVPISGDSMEPYIQDGETVFVKETCELEEGDVGIFCVNGEMFCKLYHLDKENNLHLLSANPNREDASVHITHDSGASVRCCGKVLLGYSVPLPEYWTN